MSWFKANRNSKFNLIFKSQDASLEAIEIYRAAMMEELGVENVEANYDESISMTPQPQAAMVIEDQKTGYIVAIVGGRGTKEGRRTLNRATDALRSPGSTFKTLAAFSAALDSAGQTLATVYNDVPFNYNDGTSIESWTAYRGIQSIRDAITRSLNIVSVKCFTVITPQLGYDYLLNYGFTTLTTNYVSGGKIYTDLQQTTVLGGLTHGVSPYEMTAAYATIANMGTYMTPKLYTRVTDSEGNVILDNTNPPSRRVIKETTAFLLTDAMVDVVSAPGGTGTAVRWSNQMAIAGKTGTSTGPKDLWFAGFTPYYTCAVWSGYDNNIITGGTNVSKDLWRSVMSRVHENLPNLAFETPPGIVTAQVCSKSGKLPIEGLCDVIDGGNIKTEYFAQGTVPVDYCDIHYQGEICAYDMVMASPNCPFHYFGYITLPLLEDPVLIPGSTVFNEDGTVTQPRTSNVCQHDAIFFENPDYEAILAGQQWELQQRAAQAAQAAAEAAAQQAQ